MSFGITPKHIQVFNPAGLSSQQSLVIALDVARNMQWQVRAVSYSGFIAYTKVNFLRSYYRITVRIAADGRSINVRSDSMGAELYDLGNNRKNTANFIAAFEELALEADREELTAIYDTYFSYLPGDDIFSGIDASTSSRNPLRLIFVPHKGFFITPLLIDLNIVLFLLMVFAGANVFSPGTDVLMAWGANYRPNTIDEPWRLLTNTFLHVGIIHLLMNMYALLYIGILLEAHLGRTKFLIAYLLTGIAGSTNSIYWHPVTVAAGASGAIFGMYGVFFAMLTTNYIDKAARRPLLASISIFLIYNLVNGLQAHIDNAAHIGGLLSGIMIGYLYVPILRDPESKSTKWVALGFITVIIVSICAYTVHNTYSYYGPYEYNATAHRDNIPDNLNDNPNNDYNNNNGIMYSNRSPEYENDGATDMDKYQKRMLRFHNMESMALEVYHLPPYTPKEKMMEELKDRGIYYWNESLQVLKTIDALNLPLNLRKRNELFKQYVQLQLDSYTLLYQDLLHNSKQNDQQIKQDTHKIEHLMKELND